MVDVANLACAVVRALKDHGGPGRVPVAVLDLDGDPLVFAEVGTHERVVRVGRLGQLDEPVRMLDDPA